MQAALTRRRLLAAAGAASLAASATPLTARGAPGPIPIIDAHTHLVRNLRGVSAIARGVSGRSGASGVSLEEAVSGAVELMNRFGIARAILSPPPFPPDRGGVYGAAELAAVAGRHPDRFSFSAGGESLNPVIQQTPANAVSAEVSARFTRAAEAIAAAGAAAFGELAAEHFSSRRGNHPYESAPPDHPLFLLLADIAARYGMPIELHMEAVPRDMPFPDTAHQGPPNPAYLHENISGLSRLLDHNRRTRVVWVHAGWDLSGARTVELMRSLLGAHPNLFMSVKSDPAGVPANAPFRPGGGLKPGWLAMLRAFPERFVIGSDQFYDSGPVRTERARKFVDWLPADIAPLVAYGNVRRIYRLTSPGR